MNRLLPPLLLRSQRSLEWWLKQQRRPILSSLEWIDLMSVTAMSAEAQRIFSGARRTISWDRSCLGGARIESFECLNYGISNQTKGEVYVATTNDLRAHMKGKEVRIARNTTTARFNHSILMDPLQTINVQSIWGHIEYEILNTSLRRLTRTAKHA